LVLEHLLRGAKPRHVVFSALGVREGFLYDLLDARERERDALIAGVEEIAGLLGRSLAHGRELWAWTDALLTSAGVIESPAEARLRHAACLLSDIAWRAHPDHRAEEALETIEHTGRAYLALAVFHRYAGSDDPCELWPRSLLTAKLTERARLVGLACRLAHVLSAGMPGVIPQTTLRVRGHRLVLGLGGALAALEGRRVHSRLRALAKLMRLESAVEV
jgi:exopolyphosphatase/guanosine-5'-triphosphate,3'-diphosphate pyrophosphatase